MMGAAVGGGCGAPPEPATPAKKAAVADTFDACADHPEPVKKKYTSILKNVRCDQELFQTMAGIAGALNVECDYCHLHDASGDAKKFDFPRMSDRKQVALFMQHEFVEGLKQKDGAPVECESCHTDKNGKPAAKFLGEPRDIPYTIEWMNLVMVNKFTHLDGTKLKCRDCHVGNYTTPEFQSKVIMRGDQVKLPGVTPYSPSPDTTPTDGILKPINPKTKPNKPPPVPGHHAELFAPAALGSG